MGNTVPVIGRLAVITLGGVTIGMATGVTSNINSDLIKDYVIGSQLPAILAQGNQSFKVSCSKLLIDGTYGNQVLGGTKVTIIIYPAGSTSAGNIKITITNVVFNTWNMKYDQKGVVGEDIAGEGDSMTIGTI